MCDGTSLPQFTYASFRKERSIRLFRVIEIGNDAISGELLEVSLAEAPLYYALSYAWGSQRPVVPLHCHNAILYVTQHLADALTQVFANTPDVAPWLWIDQISINQLDDNEKLEQVQLMGAIYTAAQRTLIWLGKADGGSQAWSLLDQLHDCSLSANPSAKCIADLPFRLYSDSRHHAWGLPDWASSIWTSLRTLLKLSWFTRTWVIQEAVLSSNDPVVMHGNIKYSWDKLSWIATWLRRNGYLRLEQMPTTFQSIDTIANIRRSKTKWTLDALLIATSYKFNATDQRDKVFAMLGMCSDTHSLTQWPVALLPDYSRTVSEVYTDVAVYLIEKSGNLATLTRAGLSPYCQEQSLLSWVPNWSNMVSEQPEKSLSWLEYAKDGGATSLGFPTHCNANGSITASVVRGQGQHIILRGNRLDTIKHRMPIQSSDGQHGPDFFQQHLLKAWRASRDTGLDRHTLSRLFVETTTAGMGSLIGRSRHQVLRDGLAFLAREAPESTKIGGSIPKRRSRALVRHDTVTGVDHEETGDVAKYLTLARNYCLHRSFWVTAGNRLGIGPLRSTEGDVVAILFGSGVPHVLRRSIDGYSLVGEAYVGGVMEGNLATTVSEEEFLLT